MHFYVSHVTIIFFWKMLWSLSVKGLLSTGLPCLVFSRESTKKDSPDFLEGFFSPAKRPDWHQNLFSLLLWSIFSFYKKGMEIALKNKVQSLHKSISNLPSCSSQLYLTTLGNKPNFWTSSFAKGLLGMSLFPRNQRKRVR